MGQQLPDNVHNESIGRFFVVRIIRRDAGFLLFTIGVCAIAATVACFQFAVFMSFLRAGAVVPRALGGDVWIVARGVSCFDFPTTFGEDYDAALVRYLPGATFRRVAMGFSPWRSPDGNRSNVAIVGVEGAGIPENAFVADQSDLSRLQLYQNAEASIGDTTLTLSGSVDTLPTFLGAPYVLADFGTTRRLLGMPSVEASYIIVDLPGGVPADFAARRAEAAAAFPEIDMMTAEEFAWSSSRYWQAKTGAGTAILLAALLAALLMVVLLINGIGRFVQRYDQDLLSLIGHGADQRELRSIVILVAGLIAAAGFVVSLVIGPVVALMTKPWLPWVAFRFSDMWLPACAVCAGFGLAVFAANRAITRFAPDAVFRS